MTGDELSGTGRALGPTRTRSPFLGRVWADRSPSQRVVICGGPRTGKTRMATTRFGSPYRVRHADSLRFTHLWSDASVEVARWFDSPGPGVVEGVATVRALRKWLRLNPGRPCDSVLYLSEPLVEREKVGQRALARGVETVWREVWPELSRRGVAVHVPKLSEVLR